MNNNTAPYPESVRKKRKSHWQIVLLLLAAVLIALCIAFFLFRTSDSDSESKYILHPEPVEIVQGDALPTERIIAGTDLSASQIRYELQNEPLVYTGSLEPGTYILDILVDGQKAGTIEVQIVEQEKSAENQNESSDSEKDPQTAAEDENISDAVSDQNEPSDPDEQTSQMENDTSGSESVSSNPAAGYGTVVDNILIVNKKHPLSAAYNPGNDPVAEQAVRTLIADAQAQGLAISSSYSGFRDYAYQENLYNGYVSRDGQALADTYSARPGYSEHQTGLTFDLIQTDGNLVESPAEAKWLQDHCAEYGFIIRYPQGKEAITGYQPEPWHLRYVGKETAEKIMSSGLTLEEYLGVEGGDYE